MKMESLSSSEVSLICQGSPGATVAKVGVVGCRDHQRGEGSRGCLKTPVCEP